MRVWIGQDGSPGCVGELIMRREDWRDLRRVLMHGRTYMGPGADITYDMSADDLAWLRGGQP